MDDRISIVTVIGWHIVSDYLVRLEPVAGSGVATRCVGFVDIGTVPMKSELVDSSQTVVNAKWGRGVVRVQPEDRVRERDRQCVSEGG